MGNLFTTVLLFVVGTGFCLFGCCFMLLGGFIVAADLITVWKGWQTRSWPLSIGRIVSTPQEADESEESPPDSENAIRESTEFAYEYEVDGQQFTAKTIQYQGNGRSTITDRIESELGSTYRGGDSVEVYYNPAKPEEALLKPGIPAGLLPMTIVGIVLFVIGLAFILITLNLVGAVKLRPDPAVMPYVPLILGLALVLFALRSLWTVFASRFWPTTEAQVLSSSVRKFSERRSGKGYQPSVTYQYEIDGTTYTGSSIDWGRFNYHNLDKAQRVADQYVEGTTVTVYYNARRPHLAVIEPRGSLIYLFLLIMGIAFTAVGAGALYGALPGVVVR